MTSPIFVFPVSSKDKLLTFTFSATFKSILNLGDSFPFPTIDGLRSPKTKVTSKSFVTMGQPRQYPYTNLPFLPWNHRAVLVHPNFNYHHL